MPGDVPAGAELQHGPDPCLRSVNDEPSYLGGGKPPSGCRLVTYGIITVVAVIVGVILIYSLPHIICGNYGAGCPHP